MRKSLALGPPITTAAVAQHQAESWKARLLGRVLGTMQPFAALFHALRASAMIERPSSKTASQTYGKRGLRTSSSHRRRRERQCVCGKQSTVYGRLIGRRLTLAPVRRETSCANPPPTRLRLRLAASCPQEQQPAIASSFLSQSLDLLLLNNSKRRVYTPLPAFWRLITEHLARTNVNGRIELYPLPCTSTERQAGGSASWLADLAEDHGHSSGTSLTFVHLLPQHLSTTRRSNTHG